VTPRRQRMIFVGVVLVGVTAAMALGLTAGRENLLYFYSPSQLKASEAPTEHAVRVGGLVVDGSVKRESGSLKVSFGLTDGAEIVTVTYAGILPDLFREGQGIVARGALQTDGSFSADEVLAKHDENYMPPEVADAIKMAQEGGNVIANLHADK